jgi:hypothetical protein
MIARIWHGWTSPSDAAAYQGLLQSEILPGIRRRAGCRGAYLLRQEASASVEFVTVLFFESFDAIRAFAGDDLEAAVVPPAARKLLSRFDERATHYEALVDPRVSVRAARA